MPEVMNTQVSEPVQTPQAIQPPVLKKPKKQKKKIFLRIFVVLCVIAILGAGGVFLFRFLT